MRQNVDGGVAGSALQKVHAAPVMGKEAKELLLKEAGIRRSCECGVGLAIIVWQDRAIPEDEIWVKVSGDHGGESFKFSFHIGNAEHPTSLYNTVPFLVFGAKDFPTNLAAT